MTLTLTSDTITPALQKLQRQAKNPRAIMIVASRGVSNLFKKHLRHLDRTHPNKLGGKRTHFWNEMAGTVNIASLSDRGASISISHPSAAHKHQGGTITAKRASMLTIPIAPEAHGRRASVLEAELGIKLFILNTGAQLFLYGQQGREQPKAYYILKASVEQGPDPAEGILPPDADIEQAALKPAAAALQRQLNPGGRNV